MILSTDHIAFLTKERSRILQRDSATRFGHAEIPSRVVVHDGVNLNSCDVDAVKVKSSRRETSSQSAGEGRSQRCGRNDRARKGTNMINARFVYFGEVSSGAARRISS